MLLCTLPCILYIFVGKSISHKSRSRFTKGWNITRFLLVILSSRRLISGLRMFQKEWPSENILLFSSSIWGPDRRYSARRNKNKNVGPILRFDHFVCKHKKSLPGTDLYAIYKSSCSLLFCENVSAIRQKGVLFICATRYYITAAYLNMQIFCFMKLCQSEVHATRSSDISNFLPLNTTLYPVRLQSSILFPLLIFVALFYAELIQF